MQPHEEHYIYFTILGMPLLSEYSGALRICSQFQHELKFGLIFNYNGLVDEGKKKKVYILSSHSYSKADSRGIQKRNLRHARNIANVPECRICQRLNDKALIWHRILFTRWLCFNLIDHIQDKMPVKRRQMNSKLQCYKLRFGELQAEKPLLLCSL